MYTIRYKVGAREAGSTLMPFVKGLFLLGLISGLLLWVCHVNGRIIWDLFTSIFPSPIGQRLYGMLFGILGAGVGGMFGGLIGGLIAFLIKSRTQKPKEIEIGLTDQDVTVQSEGIQATYAWGSIKHVRRWGKTIMLIISLPGFSSCAVIPTSAFDERELADAFFSICQKPMGKASDCAVAKVLCRLELCRRGTGIATAACGR